MDASIKRLKSTTFFGRRFTRRQLEEIQSMVRLFRRLSRRELAQTVCENFDWRTESGENRVFACLKMLEALEQHGVLRLPAKDTRVIRGARAPLKWTERGEPGEPVECELAQLAPIQLQLALEGEDTELFDELIDRYHYLGFRQPMGCYLRYFIVDGQGRKLGCLLFQQASVKLKCRDEWIGWHDQSYKKRLNQVVQNSRFVIFPWVRVKNLASHSWSLVRGQLASQWHMRWQVRPVLVESFVDREGQGFSGSSYRAGGWHSIGQTELRSGKSVKDVYVLLLREDALQILKTGKASNRKPRPGLGQVSSACGKEPFVQLWQSFIADAAEVAGEYDLLWQKRRRVLNTLLIMLFIFRLVFASNREGYQTVINELWGQCRLLQVSLPQQRPVRASAMCNARAKLDESVFKQLHRRVVARLDEAGSDADSPGLARWWCGRRLLAVDGTKMVLPRALLNCGYHPCGSGYYPQGLVSCLYRLGDRQVIDFELSCECDERQLARQHLREVRAGEVVVYDRGYYSYELLRTHLLRGVDAIFRLPKGGAGAPFEAFIDSAEEDSLVTVAPPHDFSHQWRQAHPGVALQPITLRCVRYRAGGTEYYLATTLSDDRQFPVAELSDAYHGRWGIEELYKSSKRHLTIEQFHAKTERGVRQELYAHFVLLTMGRAFGNEIEEDINGWQSGREAKMRANFKNALKSMAQNFEVLMLGQCRQITQALDNILESIANCVQRERPNRSYARHTMRPDDRFGNINRSRKAT